MTELSTLMRTSVDHPVAPPPSIEALAGRGNRRRVRRLRAAALAAVAAVALPVGVALLTRGGSEPVALNVTGPDAQSAAYLATAEGGYEAAGTWRLTIVRGAQRITYDSTTSPACAATGTIQRGDRVYGEIDTPGSFVRAGEGAHCRATSQQP